MSIQIAEFNLLEISLDRLLGKGARLRARSDRPGNLPPEVGLYNPPAQTIRSDPKRYKEAEALLMYLQEVPLKGAVALLQETVLQEVVGPPGETIKGLKRLK